MPVQLKTNQKYSQQSVWGNLNLGFVLFPFIYDGEVTQIKNYDFSGNSHSCFYHTF